MKKRSGRIIIYILLILIAASILRRFLLAAGGRGASRGETAVAPTPAFEIVDIVVASQFIPAGVLLLRC